MICNVDTLNPFLEAQDGVEVKTPSKCRHCTTKVSSMSSHTKLRDEKLDVMLLCVSTVIVILNSLARSLHR